jgi:hypothetical protein
LHPTQKGTEVDPRVTRQPTKIRIAGVQAGSELAAELVAQYQATISHFHRAAAQNYSLSILPFQKFSKIYPVGVGSRIAQDQRKSAKEFVPGSSAEMVDVHHSNSGGGRGAMALTYTNHFGNERIDIEMSAELVRELQEELIQRRRIFPVRDIQLGGYIALHNANVSASGPEDASEAVEVWSLEVNGVVLGGGNLPSGAAHVFVFGDYMPRYHSWNDVRNPFPVIGPPTPKFPGNELDSRSYYPMFGLNPEQPGVNELFFNASPYTFANDSVSSFAVSQHPLDALNLFGDNDVFVRVAGYDVTVGSSASAGWVYGEFFGRFAREVEASWNYPREEIGGVPRKLLINDYPFFWGAAIGGVPRLRDGAAYIGGVDIDLGPPLTMGDPATALRAPGVSDIYPAANRAFNISGPDGFPISLFDPWP